MSHKSYMILWIFFQLLVEINCQMTPFKPMPRDLHTATVIDNKLYILGGNSDVKGSTVGKDFFYLDVSVTFNTQNLLWKDLSTINSVPSHYGATSVGGGKNNNTLFLYGGATTDPTAALVYTYDPQSNTWSTPKIIGINTTRKRTMTGIRNNVGKYTINLNWGEGSLISAPTPRTSYGAILLSNNNIVYAGGYNAVELGFNQVYIYDTINDSWNIKATSGKIPSNRDGFSAVLGMYLNTRNNNYF
ncbi:hypothetical protein C1645_832675 [Glomus cerebriforme]|uniref:Galactose oxidase n=1 Tax=Glomus cerebriforme TaxID=658196 RepID=A0A397SJK2_9GLOM|nr:hypothetical protein C1645_832675 [Glomus cerebriforme]